MKDITSVSKSKEILFESKANKEWIYYVCLFGSAFVAAVVLIFIGHKNENAGLKTYAAVLAPLFALAAAISARLLFASINQIFTKNGTLYIKRPFYTKRIALDKIETVTVAKYGDKGLTSLKITYGEKSAKYSLAGVTREDAARLKKMNKQ